MKHKLKDKLADIFWEFVMNLTEASQEIWNRVVNRKSYISVRKIMKEINSNLRRPFFLAVLKTDEMLIDFSKGQFEKRGVEVPVKKGQYRLERKLFRWGSNNPEMPWLVLENTTIGAREAWWRSRAALNEISLKLDANI